MLDWMELEYVGLVEGHTLSGQQCPSCKARGVMSVSRMNRQILWLCHRASCGFRRGSKYGGFVPAPPESPPEDERVVIYPPTQPLPEAVYEKLIENYHLTRRSINRAQVALYVDNYGNERYYLPILNRDGTLGGYNAKVVEPDVKPKTLTKTSLPSQLCWYPNTTKSRKILVVEDQLSAIRASEHLTAVSILGTHLNEARVKGLMKADPEEILLALDFDAFDKAVRYVIQFKGLTAGRMKVVKITKDVKNMNVEMFNKFIEGILL